MKRAVAFSLLVVACGSDEGGRGDGAIRKAPYELCDGSEGVRLALVTGGGGPMPDDYAFSQPYGSRFLYVDGRCNFVANAETRGKLITGTFTAEQGKALSDSLALEATAGVLYSFQPLCPDAPANVLVTPDAFIQSGCGDDHPPTQVAASLNWDAAFALARSVGRAWTGPVSTVALPYDVVLNSAILWTFAWPIEQITYEGTDGASYEQLPKHAKTLQDGEAASARELWSLIDANQTWDHFLPMTSGGRTYKVFFRDELESALADQLVTFRNARGMNGARAIARCDERRVETTTATDRDLYEHVVVATLSEQAPCGVELCWDGSFDESQPVQASVLLQEPAEPRTCLGAPVLSVTANLQPMIDAYRASYPSSPVKIDLGFATLRDDTPKR